MREGCCLPPPGTAVSSSVTRLSALQPRLVSEDWQVRESEPGKLLFQEATVLISSIFVYIFLCFTFFSLTLLFHFMVNRVHFYVFFYVCTCWHTHTHIHKHIENWLLKPWFSSCFFVSLVALQFLFQCLLGCSSPCYLTCLVHPMVKPLIARKKKKGSAISQVWGWS